MIYYIWEFITTENNKVYAKYTDEEIEKKKKNHPEIKFNDYTR